MIRDVKGRIFEARRRCAAQVEAGGALVSFVWVAGDLAEQVHHGTTDYALAAWYDWRTAHPGRILKARGVNDYLIPNLKRERKTPALGLVLEAEDRTALVLTGCAWGYGGEGPHGCALVLTDAGFFPDLEAAQRFVSLLDFGKGWELVQPNEGG